MNPSTPPRNAGSLKASNGGVRIGSATIRLGLKAPLQTKHVSHPEVGDVVVVEVLNENPAYRFLEQPSGVLTKIRTGDQIVGVLGSRQALRGYVGYAPAKLKVNDELCLLNMGGVIGRFIDSTTELGGPIKVRYLGTVVDQNGTVNMKRAALPVAYGITQPRPIVFVVGTCMHVGKTATAARLIEVATAAGYRVGAAKLSGVAAIKDLNKFSSAGAVDVKSFIDCGLPSTVDAENLPLVVKTVINALEGDIVIVELGDGIMGNYKVSDVLTDPTVMRHVSSLILCAGDILAAYGAKKYLDELHIRIHAFSGLATETVTGSEYIQEKFGIPAINGLKHPWKLFEALRLHGAVKNHV